MSLRSKLTLLLGAIIALSVFADSFSIYTIAVATSWTRP